MSSEGSAETAQIIFTGSSEPSLLTYGIGIKTSCTGPQRMQANLYSLISTCVICFLENRIAMQAVHLNVFIRLQEGSSSVVECSHEIEGSLAQALPDPLFSAQ